MDECSSGDKQKSSGLTEPEARIRLAQIGPNIIRTGQTRSILHILGETLREPTFVLLLAAGGFYLFLGSLGEGLFVFAGAVVSLGLVILQEARSERALQALQALAEPEARKSSVTAENGEFPRVKSSPMISC